jgi:quaternary ammonium compound-resistance protein SugE
MAWTILVIAGLFEIVWALGLKSSAGFTRLWPSVLTIAAMIISFYLLSIAMRSLPVGTAYTVWTGIGAIGTVVFGMIWYGDPITAGRMLCLALILAGVIGLKVL